MSVIANENSTEPDGVVPKKKGKLLLIVGVIAVLGASGTGGFYLWSKTGSASEKESLGPEKSGKSAKSKTDDKKDPDRSEKEGTLAGSLPDDENVKQVVELQPFIVNLADTDSAKYLRLSVSLGLGEEGEEKPSPLFLTRVKNAMLAVMTTKASADVLTVEGKARLRQELLEAAQAASDTPHVEAIYITDFIVQL